VNSTQPTLKDQIFKWLNTLLVANVFFVLFAFAWFAIALLGRSLKVNLGFDLWYQLWQPVFTPAIGLLMGGAIVSGIISQLSKRLKSQ
jgi:TRAP-type C4-dicarboxylate transport system permease small subunit